MTSDTIYDGKQNFLKEKNGKISDKKLSIYGKKRLDMYNGERIHFADGTLELKKNKLVNAETGEVIDTIDSDRKVNKFQYYMF